MSGRSAGLRGEARRLAFGLATLLGLGRRGFFIPYRYAAAVEPAGYPALEPLFAEAEGRCEAVLDEIERLAPDLLRIRDGDGPARFSQSWFPRLDAASLYAIVRRERPARIVEIGSGHSTRFLARAVADGGLATEIVAVDPAPRSPLAGLAVRHERRLFGPEDADMLGRLAASDILFVDSSHVAMPGTDVDRLVGDVLPQLPAGVLVHVHDVVLPDGYPERWRWRGYNEQTVVAALLGGGGYEIEFASHWIAARRPERLEQGVLGQLPLPAEAIETSLWLRKRPPRDAAAA